MIHHFLENSAARYPDKTAVIHNNERVTYSRINILSDNLARHLHANGIRWGDRVALLMENSVDYIVSYYGILKAGAVASPLNPALKPDGLDYLFENLEPAAIITTYKSERLLKAVSISDKCLKLLIIKSPKQKWQGSASIISTFEEGISEQTNSLGFVKTNKNSLASIIYTSGSTGKSKGVMLSHGNIVSNTLSICQSLALGCDEIQMVVLPFFYVMGKSLLNTHFAVGGTVVINNTFSYPATVVRQIIEEKVTGFSGVPSTFAYLLHRSPLSKHRDQLQSLRYCSQAGGHMAVQLKKDLRMVLPEHTKIVIMYGATEASPRLSYLDPEMFESKIKSIGKPVPGVELRLIDIDGKTIKNGSTGELVAKGPNIMKGYWKDHESTRKVIDKNGFYHTGDMAWRDDDGHFYITGRKDNMLKVSGHKVNPKEIEECLMKTRQLLEVVVIGIPDRFNSYKLVGLCVPLEKELKEIELQKKCHQMMLNYQVPGEFVFLKVLPKGSSGKVDKQKCEEAYKKLAKSAVA